jgi:hypothetical protein
LSKTGCYVNVINIIFFTLYAKNKKYNNIKKVAYFFINSLLIGILDLSLNFIAFTLTRSNNFLYKLYKKKTYNIFLDLIN